MDDWEQPNTTAMLRSPVEGSSDSAADALRQQLSEVLVRMAALEERVKQLEARA
jgi:hypothetical protein